MFQVKWLWKNLEGYHARYISALIGSVLCMMMYLTSPILVQLIVDNFIVGENALENLQTKPNVLVWLCVAMIGFVVLRSGLQYFTAMNYEHSSQGLIYRVRNHLYSVVQQQDSSYFDKNRTGDIMTRLSGDLDMVRHSVAWIVKNLLESLALFTVAVVYFFVLDPLMAVCMLALTPLIFIISIVFKNKIGPMYVDLRERLSNLNTAAQENISGNRVVKAFAREDYEIQRFSEKNHDYSEANKAATLTWIKFFPYIETVAQSLSVVMIVFGGIFVMNGRLSFGEYGAFSGMVWTISNPMRNVGALINDMQRFMASATKIIEVYYSRPTIVDRVDAVSLSGRIKGDIEFKNVSFKYGNSEILSNINLKINAGETIAIMGETGSGKTSLINLIPRFYDVSSGEVLVDGTNVRMLKLAELRSSIGMAMQDVLLFSDTIDGNIAYGDTDLSEDEVKEFARLSAAHDFIEKMPDGYETIVGERGVGLSGGQKQRISLARAIAVKPSILILDDTTSAVDMETEKFIQESLENLDFACTKIIIAQRISSTKSADKIVILKNGAISEMGTHEELKNSGGYYSEVCALQSNQD